MFPTALIRHTAAFSFIGMSLVSPVANGDNTIPGAPGWSVPARGELTEQADVTTLKTVPGSKQSYTQQQIDDKFSAPDWFPDDHQPMPGIVQFGKAPEVWACASCHLASGLGHPESSTLAGLSSSYLQSQLKAFASGERLDYSGHMNRMAVELTEQEIKQVSDWFASLKPVSFLKVVEAVEVPLTQVDSTRMRQVTDYSQKEHLDGRIIEVAEKPEEVLKRAPYETFISYVPEGSIERGRNLVITGAGKTIPCSGCHGNHLMGTEIAPAIASNFGIYTVRQLHGFKSGTRKGAQSALMLSGDTDIFRYY